MKRVLLFVLLLFIWTNAYSEEVLEIRIPSSLNGGDDYSKGVLKLALEKVDVKFKLIEVGSMNQKRAVVGLKTDALDLIWMGTSSKFENEVLPIRFPLYKGLMGYRLFLIHQENQKLFNNETTLEDLVKLNAVQGLGWSDVSILEGAGLKVIKGEYKNLFKFINRGRGVFFPRGITEAFKELEERPALYNLAVEDNVVLHYPFAFLFFTSKIKVKLNHLIRKGLEIALSDGSFTKYFHENKEVLAALQRAKINERLEIYIENPFMSKETLELPSKYWFKPHIN